VDAQPGIRDVLAGGLAPYGIPLLGMLPRRPILSNPTLEMVAEGLGAEMLHPGPDLERVIDGVAIGAMEPVHMLERVGPGTLVIVPGDREDIILTLTTAHLVGAPRPAKGAGLGAEPTLALPLGHEGAAIGLVLTGGYRPRPAVLNAIVRANLFATLVSSDTYSVASDVHDLLVKTHPADREKIELIKELVADNLDVDRILSVATEATAA
ncbi:MAG TPA: DRTGG domain-containing protein, partial [Candidatus Limnocylindrales bacterium]